MPGFNEQNLLAKNTRTHRFGSCTLMKFIFHYYDV